MAAMNARARSTEAGQGDPSLAEYLLTMSRVLVGVAARSLSGNEDITVPQFRMLVLLAQKGPLRAADIAAGLATSPSQATRLCDRLVRKQLITRESVPNDRRGVLVLLSAQGQQLLDEVMRRRLAEIETIIEAIPDDERDVMRDAFESLCRAAGEAPADSWPKYWEL
jgi:DNA-binding MarR family transcriptional regulator